MWLGNRVSQQYSRVINTYAIRGARAPCCRLKLDEEGGERIDEINLSMCGMLLEPDLGDGRDTREGSQGREKV